MHLTQFRLLRSQAPRAWFSFVALLPAPTGGYVKVRQAGRELSQYTLMPPNFFLTRRASVEYPSQKPPASAAGTAMSRVQGRMAPPGKTLLAASPATSPPNAGAGDGSA